MRRYPVRSLRAVTAVPAIANTRPQAANTTPASQGGSSLTPAWAAWALPRALRLMKTKAQTHMLATKGRARQAHFCVVSFKDDKI